MQIANPLKWTSGHCLAHWIVRSRPRAMDSQWAQASTRRNWECLSRVAFEYEGTRYALFSDKQIDFGTEQGPEGLILSSTSIPIHGRIGPHCQPLTFDRCAPAGAKFPAAREATKLHRFEEAGPRKTRRKNNCFRVGSRAPLAPPNNSRGVVRVQNPVRHQRTLPGYREPRPWRSLERGRETFSINMSSPSQYPQFEGASVVFWRPKPPAAPSCSHVLATPSRSARLRTFELTVVRSEFQFGSVCGRRSPRPADDGIPSIPFPARLSP